MAGGLMLCERFASLIPVSLVGSALLRLHCPSALIRPILTSAQVSLQPLLKP